MAHNLQHPFSSFIFVALFSFLVKLSYCLTPKLLNVSINNVGYSPALATWYGKPTGAGSGGACGFANDVSRPPFSAMISAGNAKLFKSGYGCGTCYKVKCTQNEACSRKAITVTITDECPGLCNAVPFHFDLSGTAFGAMAKPRKASALRQLGQVDIYFKRVPCNYGGTKLAFHVDKHANPYYFAVAIEYENGDGNIGLVDIKFAKKWIRMTHSWGAVWKIDIKPTIKGPFSIRVISFSGKSLVADNVIPANWAPDRTYRSWVNFS